MDLLEKRQAIASLPGHFGYQELLLELESLVTEAVVMVVNSDTEAQTLKSARNLQALFKYLNILKTTPEQIRNEFEEEKRLIMSMGDDPIFTPQRRQLLQEIETAYDPDTGLPLSLK